MTIREIVLTIVDTAALTAGVIAVIGLLAWGLSATVDWIKGELAPEEELEIIDDK